MGLRSGLPHLGSPRRCVADLAAPIQLASAAQQSKIKSAHQPPRSYRGQPVEAPHLARLSHTFCDTEAIRSEEGSRCKSLTAAGQADPFRQSVFQPSAGKLMDIG